MRNIAEELCIRYPCSFCVWMRPSIYAVAIKAVNKYNTLVPSAGHELCYGEKESH